MMVNLTDSMNICWRSSLYICSSLYWTGSLRTSTFNLLLLTRARAHQYDLPGKFRIWAIIEIRGDAAVMYNRWKQCSTNHYSWIIRHIHTCSVLAWKLRTSHMAWWVTILQVDTASYISIFCKEGLPEAAVCYCTVQVEVTVVPAESSAV